MLLRELETAGIPETEHTVGRPEHPARLNEQSGQSATAARRMSAQSFAAGARSHGGRGSVKSGGARVRANGRTPKQAWDPVHAHEQHSLCFT